MSVDLIRYLELFLLLIFTVASDIKLYKIKNIILIPFIFIGFLTNYINSGVNGIKFSFFGLLIPIIFLIALYALRMLGAGDIKLFGTIGSILGAEFCMYIMAYSFISGGIIALLLIIFRKNGRARIKFFLQYFKTCVICFSLLPYTDFENKSDGGKFHFAVAIALGTCIYMIIY